MDYLYREVIVPRKDVRMEQWFMMQEPNYMLSSLGIYLLLNLVILPNIMKNRKAFSLKNVLRIYNIFQIIVNIAMFKGVLKMYTSRRITPFGCHDVDRSEDRDSLNLAWWMWFYFITRVIDLIETSFFYLRKKNEQASFLHYYHHVAAVFVTWVGIKMVPGGSYSFPVLINTFVHTVMYTYYLLAAEAGPELRKKIQKYKKMLTLIQMTQFVIILIQSAILISPICNIPTTIFYFHIPNISINFVLFIKFFKNTYKKKQDTIVKSQ